MFLMVREKGIKLPYTQNWETVPCLSQYSLLCSVFSVDLFLVYSYAHSGSSIDCLHLPLFCTKHWYICKHWTLSLHNVYKIGAYSHLLMVVAPSSILWAFFCRLLLINIIWMSPWDPCAIYNMEVEEGKGGCTNEING